MKKTGGKEEGDVVDGRLLTNRKHVGETMNVGVLKAALKERGRMGGETEMLTVK